MAATRPAGRGIRDRWRTGPGTAFVAILALAILLAGLGGLLLSRHHAPRPTTGPPPAPAPAVATPEPYLVDGRTVHLGNAVVPLPAGWVAQHAFATVAGVLLDVRNPVGEFAALAAADGTVERLDIIAPPLAVTAGGTAVAGSAPGHPNALVLLALPGEEFIDQLTSSRRRADLAVLSSADGADEFLVEDRSGGASASRRYLIWRPQQQTLTPLPGQLDAGPAVVPTASGGWYALGTGTFFASLVRHDGQGRPLWGVSLQWPSASVPQLSPRGDRFAVDSATTDTIHYIDARSGRVLSQTSRVSSDETFTGGDPPVWVGPSILVVSRMLANHGSALYWCIVGDPDCSLLALSPGRIDPVSGPWSSAP